jgi:hypothetical protein
MEPQDAMRAATAHRDPQEVFASPDRQQNFLSPSGPKVQAPYRPQKALLAERGNDLYETPPEAVRALLKAERLPLQIWEPACGPGAIVRVLRNAGHKVCATDLIDYGLEDSTARIDFLMESHAPPGVEAIVTNPPYKLAAQFVEHALDLCPLVIMLLPLTFIAGQRRAAILESGSLARVHVFKNRLPRMHRAERKGPRATSTVEFAWFAWDCSHRGPAEVHRVSWEGAP